MIKNTGGIDIQILGIGTNGHIAFNEPGSSRHSATRIVDLTENTINDKLKKTRQVLSEKEPTYLINTLIELKHCIVPLYLKN